MKPTTFAKTESKTKLSTSGCALGVVTYLQQTSTLLIPQFVK